jgi:hypothetical protein
MALVGSASVHPRHLVTARRFSKFRIAINLRLRQCAVGHLDICQSDLREPGTDEWTWGTGAHADSFTLEVGPVAPVSEPASLSLLVMGLAGLGIVLRTRRA